MRLAVAKVTSAVGLKGHVRLKVSTDDPAGRFIAGAVFFTDNGAELTVAEVRSDGRSFQLVFVGYQDRTAAEALRDTVLFIDSAGDLRSPDEFFYHELVGLPVVDLAGIELGIVRQIKALPAQDLIVVATQSGEVLVPFVSQIVREVTEGGLVVDPPGGMFEPVTQTMPEADAAGAESSPASLEADSRPNPNRG